VKPKVALTLFFILLFIPLSLASVEPQQFPFGIGSSYYESGPNWEKHYWTAYVVSDSDVCSGNYYTGGCIYFDKDMNPNTCQVVVTNTYSPYAGTGSIYAKGLRYCCFRININKDLANKCCYAIPGGLWLSSRGTECQINKAADGYLYVETCPTSCPSGYQTREYVGCEGNDKKKYAIYQVSYQLVKTDTDCYCKESKNLVGYDYEKVEAPSPQCYKTYKGCVNKQKVWEENCKYYAVVNCQVVKTDEKTVGYTENVECCSNSDCPKISIPNGWKEGTCQNFVCSYTVHCLEGYELVNGECRPKIYPPQPPPFDWLMQIFQAIINFFKSLFGFK